MNEVSMLNILDSTREGIVIINQEYKIIFANKSFCEDAKFTCDQVVGKSCHKIMHHKQAPCFETGESCPVKHTFETARASTCTHLHFDQYGDAFYVDEILCPLHPSLAGSSFVFVVCRKNFAKNHAFGSKPVGTQIEAIKNWNEKFLHDFYNILSPLFTYSEILDEELPNESPLRACVNGILKGAERAREFVKQIQLPCNCPEEETRPLAAFPDTTKSIALAPFKPDSTSRERILFVDDEDLVAAAGKRLLERIGYQVDMYTCALEALKTFKEQPNAYDLVITDLTMPKMPGDQLSRELLKIRADIPVIICTGLNQTTTEKFKAIGIHYIINKPITSIELSEKIKSALGRKDSSRKNFKRQRKCEF